MLRLELVYDDALHPLDLADGEHTVGRASDNSVRISSPRVSKYHAVLRRNGERLFVKDLGSTNGTDLDGRRVGRDEVEVPAGSVVSLGGVIIRRRSLPTSLARSFVRPDQVSAALRYNIRDGYSQTARDRIVAVSSQLFELLASSKSAGDIETAACRFVAQCVSADRVVLMTDSGEATSIEASARWTREGDDRAPLHLSTTILNQVTRQRDSVLVSNPLEDPDYTGQQSIVALSLRSAMAVPLFDNERVRGILYVDTADPRVRYNKDDLEVLTATANAVAVKLRNISLESELRVAAKIQRSMLPDRFDVPPGYEIDAHQVMCRHVGGDLYDFRRRPNGRMLLVLGDVSGKGTPAALAMSAVVVALGLLSDIGGDIRDVASLLNRQLHRSLGEGQFVTLFLGELDGTSGVLEYVSAGHEPPFLLRADGAVERLGATGIPIAMMENAVIESAEVTIAPGDLLAVFSDGIPEATKSGDTFFGVDRLEEVLVAGRNGDLPSVRRRIESAVESFLQGEPNSDDVTLLLLRRCAAGR
jgi:hypothetical protein